MKLSQLNEARYKVGNITPVTVHQVHELYKKHDNYDNQAKRLHAEREGDRYVSSFSELQVDQSARQRRDKNGNVFAQLVFRDHNKEVTLEELKRWVLEYAKENQLPYTDVVNRGTSSISLQFRIPTRR